MTLSKEREAEIREEIRMSGGGGMEGELLAALDECRASLGACVCDPDGKGMCHRCAINHVNSLNIKLDEYRAERNDALASWKAAFAENEHLKAQLEECRAELAATKLARSQPDHYTVELVSLRKERDALLLACREMVGALEFYADSFAIMDSIAGTYEIMERWYSKARGALTSTRKILKDAGVEL